MTTTRSTAHRVLWLVQWPLSIALFLEGLFKAGLAAGDLPARLQLASGAPSGPLGLAGGVEVVLALALVLPAATRFLPSLTPVAAGCLALGLSSAALGAGLPFGTGVAALDLGVAAAAALVALGRVTAAPIAAVELGPEHVDPFRRPWPVQAAGAPSRAAAGSRRGRDTDGGSIAA